MTLPDDGRDEPGRDAPEGSDLPFDEDAAWRSIVENYGERPALGEPVEAVEPVQAPEPRPDVPPAADPGAHRLFDTAYLDAQADEQGRQSRRDAWSDEGHFVPPEPPPVPRTTPARRLAWTGLFGAPVLMLLAVVAHLTYPTWFSMGLVVAFVGGFVFLVATMERHGGDRWGDDDGAVV
jgi:hypothetical protein